MIMKEPTLLVIEHEDLKRLDLLNNTTWGIVADLNSIQTQEDFDDIGIDAYCNNLKKESE